MGRKAFFTRQEIFQAADALAAQGEDVTVRALHAYMGGGSFSSILKSFDEWKRTRQVAETPPVEKPAIVTNAFDAIWNTAMAQASQELTADREKMAQQIQEAEMRVDETIGALEETENKNNELTEKVEALTSKLNQAESKQSQTQSEKSALAAVNQQLKEEVEKLQKTLERLQMSQEDQQRRHGEELSVQAQKNAEGMNALKVDMAKLEAALASAKEDVSKNQERLIVEAQEHKEELSRVETKLEERTKERDKAIKEAAELNGRAEELSRQNTELLTVLERKSERTKIPQIRTND